MIDIDTVWDLVRDVAKSHRVLLPAGASLEEIEEYQRKENIPFPRELVEWVHSCNAPLVGPGGIYGISMDNLYVDIAYRSGLHPQWREVGWLPVAGDGAGSYYVIDMNSSTASGHAILYIDEYDYSKALYVVASNLWTFLWFYLQEEIGEDFWPFDVTRVLEVDPDIIKCEGYPTPWDYDRSA